MQQLSLKKRIHLLYIVFSLSIFISGCKKFISVDPPVTSVTGVSVYTSDITASAVLTGLYANLSSTPINANGGISSISRQTGLSADEFTLWSGQTNVGQIAYYKNQLAASLNGTSPGSEFWQTIYPYIYVCNSSIEGLTASNNITPAVKQQLLGESKFTRALLYFYLVNLYGDVPLLVSTDYTFNSTAGKTSKAAVFQQIITDLTDAKGLLSESYVKSDAQTAYPTPAASERVRPNKYSAIALLARAYLYVGDYANAEIQSSTVINNTSFYNLAPLNSVFLKNSMEAIWQLQPVTNANGVTNTQDGYQFIIPSTGPSTTFQVYLSNSLLNNFETGDQRRTLGNWVNSVTVSGTTYYFPYKYKNNSTSGGSSTEYLMILRLGEQYLIRAEARAQLNNLTGSLADLNTIRTRAGLPTSVASTQSSLITAIMRERQVELFSELGHRWFDLKRTGNIDGIMTAAAINKNSTWNSYQQLYPILLSDIQRNSNLIQNQGY